MKDSQERRLTIFSQSGYAECAEKGGSHIQIEQKDFSQVQNRIDRAGRPLKMTDERSCKSARDAWEYIVMSVKSIFGWADLDDDDHGSSGGGDDSSGSDDEDLELGIGPREVDDRHELSPSHLIALIEAGAHDERALCKQLPRPGPVFVSSPGPQSEPLMPFPGGVNEHHLSVSVLWLPETMFLTTSYPARVRDPDVAALTITIYVSTFLLFYTFVVGCLQFEE